MNRGGVDRIWGERNYPVPAAGLLLGGGGGGGGGSNPPAPNAGDEAYTPAKAVAELLALNPHASAIGLRAQDIARQLPALTGAGATTTAAPPTAPPPPGALQVFDDDDDDAEKLEKEQQQQQEQQREKKKKNKKGQEGAGGSGGKQQQQGSKAAAAAEKHKRQPNGSRGDSGSGDEEQTSSSESESDDEAQSTTSSSPSPSRSSFSPASSSANPDDEALFISLGAAAEREALLERQQAEDARRAAEDARRAAVEGRAFGFRPPWLLPSPDSPNSSPVVPRSPTLRLHNELVAFARMLEPTPAEAAARRDSVARVREAVAAVFPNARVLIFGSYATGLYVPTSDIDVVVVGSGAGRDLAPALHSVAKQLTQRGLVRPGTLTVIAKARVPIVKFEMAGSGVAFDVSFDVSNGPRAARHVARLLRAWPPLRPLVLALKVFLHQRELNEVFTGGIGSYALIVMAASALQLHASRRGAGGGAQAAAAAAPASAGQKRGREKEAASGASTPSHAPLDCNLGILLVDFFRLYGRTLNVERVGVTCADGGAFIAKVTAGRAAMVAASKAAGGGSGGGGGGGGGGSSRSGGGAVGGQAVSTHLGVDWRVPDRPFLYAVRDPLDPGNDIARNSYNVPRVRAAFDFAYQALTAPLADGGGGGGGAGGGGVQAESLLGRVIHLQPVLEGRALPRWPEAGGGARQGSAAAAAAAAVGGGRSSGGKKARRSSEGGGKQQQQQQGDRPASGKAKARSASASASAGGGGGGGDDEKPAKRARGG